MPPNLKQIPSPQLRLSLILMIFLLSENDADMTEIIHFALFGKNSLFSWPFVCFFLNIPELPGCSLYLFPKLIKSEIVWLFSEIRYSHGCFLAFFTQENTLLSCPYLVKICSKNVLFFLHWFPHFLLKTKKNASFWTFFPL